MLISKPGTMPVNCVVSIRSLCDRVRPHSHERTYSYTRAKDCLCPHGCTGVLCIHVQAVLFVSIGMQLLHRHSCWPQFDSCAGAFPLHDMQLHSHSSQICTQQRSVLWPVSLHMISSSVYTVQIWHLQCVHASFTTTCENRYILSGGRPLLPLNCHMNVGKQMVLE